MAPHSSTLAWKIPWTEEPSRLQSMGSLRVGYDWATSLSFSLSCIGEGNGNPLQCSCLENPRDGGAWWAAVYGVTWSRTLLKWLSNSSRKSWGRWFTSQPLLTAVQRRWTCIVEHLLCALVRSSLVTISMNFYCSVNISIITYWLIT